MEEAGLHMEGAGLHMKGAGLHMKEGRATHGGGGATHGGGGATHEGAGLHIPTTSMRSSDDVAAPSSWTRNSVLIRREASCSLSERWERRESISSMKTTAGW